MRYFILFFITIVLTLFIMFYNPYLGVYKDKLTIEYDFNEEGYSWNYTVDNDNIELIESSDSKWVFVPKKNGKTKLVFNYSNNDINKYSIYYIFKVRGNKIFWLEGEGTGLMDYPNPY